jgi:hypothetical protein
MHQGSYEKTPLGGEIYVRKPTGISTISLPHGPKIKISSQFEKA